MKLQSVTFLVFTILFIGLIFISISSVSEAAYTAGDKLYFIRKQLLWSAIGAISYIIATKINLKLIKKNASLIYFTTIILLAILLLPSFSSVTLGARRWLDLGIIGIQPSEILKLASIIFFAKLFSAGEGRSIKKLVIWLGIPLVLVLLEPNLSTTILIAAIVLTIYYLSGGDIVPLFFLCLGAVAICLVLIVSSPYRKARFDSTSYHSNQMILALSSGHFFGKGFANSDQKYRFLPKISTDSILAVIGEETGFVGNCVIISLYIFLVLTLFKITTFTGDPFTKLLIAGVASWISYQSLINISAVASLIPLTGVPLPLISYGGSSLITLMFGLGLVNNVYSTNREKTKESTYHRHTSHSGHRANQSVETGQKN